MSSVLSFDELNIQSGKQRSEPYKEYFDKMQITEKEKKQRIAFSEQMEEAILYIFALVETMLETGEIDREYIKSQLQEKYTEIASSYAEIDPYIQNYIIEFSRQIVDTTFSHLPESNSEDESSTSDNAYYLSNDRAMFISECEANTLLNYKAHVDAVESGKTYKTWVDIGDERERPTHLEVGGTKIPIDEAFAVGNSLLMFPHDTSLGAESKEIVNCRCSVKYS